MCFPLRKTIDYPRHVIARGRLRVAQKTTKAIRLLWYQTTLSLMRSFLGLCNVHRRFVPNLPTLVLPLNQRLKKGALRQFEPDSAERDEVDVLKEKLIKAPISVLQRLYEQYTFDGDTCDTQVGCVLLREPDDIVLKQIGYLSLPLCDAEIHYDTIHEECPAVIWAV